MNCLEKLKNKIFPPKEIKAPVDDYGEMIGIDWAYFKQQSKKQTLINDSSSRIHEIIQIYKGFELTGDQDLRTFAYGLATCRIEVGYKLKPVREGFKKTDAEAREHVRNRAYGKQIGEHSYYGRGYVQLTWDYNYEAEGIIDNPDKALEPDFAARLLFKGLLDGRWNGRAKGLKYYLDKGDIKGARRTVNVQNKAQLVADFYKQYLKCLRWVK
jgi:hypothetical protein